MLTGIVLAFLLETVYYEQPVQNHYDFFDLFSRRIPVFERVGYIKHLNIVAINFVKSCFSVFYISPEEKIEAIMP